MKCLYQAREVSGCVFSGRDNDFATFYNFLLYLGTSDSVVGFLGGGDFFLFFLVFVLLFCLFFCFFVFHFILKELGTHLFKLILNTAKDGI